jgi:signal transduction histidine kinase
MKNGAERLINAGRAMWVLTSTDGAFRVEDEVFKAYSKATGDLPSNDVRSVHEDANGILIGTSAGLTRILPNGERITFDASNGLAGLPVISVFPVRRTDGEPAAYWVVTPNHMHRLVDSNLLRGNSLATLSKELSATHWVLPTDDYSTMLLGTGNGLVMYDLTQTGRSIPPPKVAIRAVSLNGTRFLPSPEGVIRQRASSSTLEFEFSGLTFVKESDTEFSYRLIDVDDDWSPAQRQRTVRYANIRPGTYTFEVRAINIDGVASTEVASIRIVIDPPWWMHPIMVIFLLLGSIAGLVAGIRWRVKTIQADIVKRNEQKQFEAIQRIGASISHDIKNTVFSLSLLSKNLEKRFDNPEFRKDAIETIESSLSYLSTLVNRLQEAPNAAASPITEIELRTLCTEIVKRVAGGSGRQVDIEMADSMRIRIHPEPIERILENLIRNAMEATPSGQSVRVMAVRQSNEVVIQVIDQGSGMSEDFIRNRLFKPFQSTKTKGLGIGLYSCKELADAMGATFEVESELGKGTTFRLRFVNSAS